jgi:hypothetical protein
VQRAIQRGLLHQRYYEFAPRILSIDVAHMGGDRNGMCARQGLQMFTPKVTPGLPEKTYAGMVARSIEKWRPDAVFVDCSGGYGHEVVSRLRDNGFTPQEVVFSWKPSDERFRNLRAEMYFRVKAWLDEGGALACGAYATALQAELCSMSYSHDNAAGKLTLESKDDIRARLGVSPDIADALAIGFAFRVVKAGEYGQGGVGRAVCDYDPYAPNQAEERRRARERAW